MALAKLVLFTLYAALLGFAHLGSAIEAGLQRLCHRRTP